MSDCFSKDQKILLEQEEVKIEDSQDSEDEDV